jgi:hypothetical protein
MAGAFKDAAQADGLSVESPISAFPDFEHLEFRGQQNHQHLGPFLEAMKRLADERRAAGAAVNGKGVLE